MRVVPSDVIGLIRRLFPANTFNLETRLAFSVGHRPHFVTILAVVMQIPAELLTFSTEDYIAFQSAISSMSAQVDYWVTRGDQAFDVTPGFKTDPVTLLYNLLAKCPDEAPASGTTGLNFIEDEILRQDLRTDKSDADRALSNGEWKAATVLFGGLIEALLLWANQKRESQVSAALSNIQKRGVVLGRANRPIEDWSLHEYIEVAAEIGIVAEDTAKQCRLAKGFRNLIHPGAEQRRSEKCGKPEALSAAAGAEHVVRDLSH